MVLFDGVNALFYECELLRNPTNKKAVIPQDKITAFLAMKDLLRTDWVQKLPTLIVLCFKLKCGVH